MQPGLKINKNHRESMRNGIKLWSGAKMCGQSYTGTVKIVCEQRGNTNRWKEREEENTSDSKNHLSVLHIRVRTSPQRDQELVFHCQRQHTASLAGQTAPSDSPPRLMQSAVIFSLFFFHVSLSRVNRALVFPWETPGMSAVCFFMIYSQ